MKVIYKSIYIVALFSATLLTSCLNRLDLDPIDPNEDTNISTPEDYFAYLTKLYAGLSNTGQNGGDGDLGGADPGATQYWRVFWNAQEFPTDEVVNSWTDEGAPDMSYMTWSANNPFVLGMYNRIYYQISATNEFLRKSADLKLEDLPDWKEDENGDKPVYATEEQEQWIAEARYLRAYSYWHALDFFGNKVPFVTEEDPIGSFMPMPAGTDERGPELFNYVMEELEYLVSAESKLPAIRQAWLGRADKGAALMLLSKLYLNHEVYLGNKVAGYYEKGREHLSRLINEGGYSLYTQAETENYSAYQSLFMADNEKTASEVIFMIMSDSRSMRHWGGTTYLIAAGIGGDMDAQAQGINSGWGGNRATPTMVDNMELRGGDDRVMFAREDEGQSKEIDNSAEFQQGYGVKKWNNLQQNGTKKNETEGVFTDTNIPVFRLADAYLMLAEFDLRIEGSVSGVAKTYVDAILERADANPVSSINLDFILDERGRELYWEGHRRTDLIRFGKYTKDMNWSFKGGSPSGVPNLSDHLELYPIPAADLGANTNLSQNAGY
ncbi:RagB/SusD family nutrient uptake outer membrane protein [Sediminitomix flava]|uniref:Putative outer membrane starch-binding protein n=1 Tax=Sediminitomix flava TaxID=379075 RepID=A0A315ZAV2_SEDFL|nr:RagB/SusD family nutrient uptake outer membrane protein [Sediminitomix flava]PWJ42480.1 putative outer membrane starch-binding protein [Sediminitomix flava]